MCLKPKKKLGQNFLFDKNIQRKIINALDSKCSDLILEIGAGRGELTGLIANKVAKIYALEIDPCLCALLNERFKGQAHIKVINQDFLKFNLRNYFRRKKFKVVGNIPYYITTPIVERIIVFRNLINTVFITVQKEFARRLTAVPGSKDYGSFSCFVQYYVEPKVIFEIKRSCFYPQPKVDSVLVRLKVRPTPLVEPKDEELFFTIIRAAFKQRRKTLRNSLRGIISLEKLHNFFTKYSLDENVRPEDLSLEDFASLINQ